MENQNSHDRYKLGFNYFNLQVKLHFDRKYGLFTLTSVNYQGNVNYE